MEKLVNTVNSTRVESPSAGTLKSAFSQWLLANHGSAYFSEVQKQRGRENAIEFIHIF